MFRIFVPVGRVPVSWPLCLNHDEYNINYDTIIYGYHMANHAKNLFVFFFED